MSERTKIILAFAMVYVLWGSTYLAIRVGVGYLPAMLFAAARFVPGGLLLLLGLALTKRNVRPRRQDWGVLFVSGFLLLVGGNGLVIVAEKTVPSGLAALVIATTPLWIAGLEAVLPGGERVSALGLGGVALGLVGLGVLSWPEISALGAAGAQPLGVLTLVLAAGSWACGTLLMRRRPIKLDPLAVTGWQMLMAGCVHLLIGLLFQRGEPTVINLELIGSLAYLIVFGSWLGFGAYVWLVHHVAPAKVVTYAYVNPVVAVFLGWLILHEVVDGFVLAGTAIILLGVALVSSAHVHSRSQAARAPGTTERAASSD